MIELAQQLSYYLSVVDGGATGKLLAFGQQIVAISNIATAAQASIMSIVNPLMQVGNAWGQREQQINNISRTLRQYQYVGQSVVDINRDIANSMGGATQAARDARFTEVYANQFQAARTTTRAILHEMNSIAALLPGEASDYIQAFNQALPFLSQAKGMNLGRAVNLTSYLTAGGIAGGIDAGQTSRDLMQFLTMGPHMMDRSWTEVWSQYATFHGKKVGAERIRGMSIDDKVQVLSEIKDQLKPMMGAMSDSFEATMGTFTSLRHELYLVATEPLFESFKKGIGAVNEQLTRFSPYLGIVAEYMSSKVAVQMDRFSLYLKNAVGDLRSFGEVVADIATRATHMYERLTGALSEHGQGRGGISGLLVQGLGSEIGFVMGGPIGMVIGAAIGRMIGTGNTGGTTNAMGQAAAMLGPALWDLAIITYRVYDMLVAATAALLTGALPPLIVVLSSTLTTLAGVLSLVVRIVLDVLLVAFIGLIGALGPPLMFVAQILRVVGVFFEKLASLLFGVSDGSLTLISVLTAVANAMTNISKQITAAGDYIMNKVGLMSDEEYRGRQMAAASDMVFELEPEWVQQLRAAFEHRDENVDLNSMRGRAPPAQRPHTSQDFRYSRFDITQKFAEGFDPDRVATAFASDLSAMAEQNLDSGFANAFASPSTT